VRLQLRPALVVFGLAGLAFELAYIGLLVTTHDHEPAPVAALDALVGFAFLGTGCSRGCAGRTTALAST